MAFKKIQAAMVNVGRILGTSAPDTDPCGMFSSYGKARGGHTPPQQCRGEGVRRSITRGLGMMGRGWDVCGGRGVGALRHNKAVGKAANQPVQTRSKSSRFGGVGMCVHHAAFSRSILAFAAATATLAALAAPAMAEGFAPGFHTFALPEGSFGGGSTTLSDDGTTFTGTLSTLGGPDRGFILNASGFNVFAEPSRSYDASDNGAYTVGFTTRRAADGTTQTLVPGTLLGNSYDVGPHISGDGQVVAGTSDWLLNGQVIGATAWRWSEATGATQLPMYRPNSLINAAQNISRDGSTIVGVGRDGFFGDRTEAWMWREGEGYTILPDVPDARYLEAEARGVNADGTIVVGKGNDQFGNIHGLVWRNGVPTALPAPATFESVTAHGVSDDGSIIIGVLADPLTSLPQTGAVWTEDTGWVPIYDYLRSNGIDVPSSLNLPRRLQMSADGLTFAAFAVDALSGRTTAFIAHIPSPSGLVSLLMLGAFCRRARARR